MKGILKDAAILFVITLVAGLCLGAVHEVTLDPIAKAQEAAATKTYKEVFPEAAKFEQTDELTAAVAASADEILRALEMYLLMMHRLQKQKMVLFLDI